MPERIERLSKNADPPVSHLQRLTPNLEDLESFQLFYLPGIKTIRKQKSLFGSIFVYYHSKSTTIFISFSVQFIIEAGDILLSAKSRNSRERGNTFNTARKDDSSEESIEQLKTTIVHLNESINHLKEANKELRTKYDKQKEFISIAAHELRSPITPILGTLEFIEYEFEESKKTEITLKKEFFDRLVRNTNRLERLVSEILDITRIDDQSLKLKKEYFNLNMIVLDAIEDHRRQIEKCNGNTELLYELKKEEKEKVPRGSESPSEDIFVDADKNRINQVIYNLLTNAIKFTKDGLVSISLMKKRGKNHINEVILSVKDTGIGIGPEILPRLFTIFATESEIGTGLGLFISKNIVEAHGGKIWGENNTDGKGATFVFSLPSQDKQ